MDEAYLFYAVRYVERNPVRAGIVEKAGNYKWSSAQSHILNTHNALLNRFYLMDEIDDWEAYLKSTDEEEKLKLFRRHAHTGRPLGSSSFIKELEKKTGRLLSIRKPGPKLPIEISIVSQN